MVYTAPLITAITFSTFNTTLYNISTVLLCCISRQRTWEWDFLISKVWRFTFLDNSGHVGRTRHQLMWPTILETSPRYQEWFCKKSCFKDINNLSKGTLVGKSGVVNSWVSGNHVVIYRKVCNERRFSDCLVGNGHCATFIHFSLALEHYSMCWAMVNKVLKSLLFFLVRVMGICYYRVVVVVFFVVRCPLVVNSWYWWKYCIFFMIMMVIEGVLSFNNLP